MYGLPELLADEFSANTLVPSLLTSAYLDLRLTDLSDFERPVLFSKISLVADILEGNRELEKHIVDGIHTKAARSKLLMLLLGFKHKLILRGLEQLDVDLSEQRSDASRRRLRHLVNSWLNHADILIGRIVEHGQLALH